MGWIFNCCFRICTVLCYLCTLFSVIFPFSYQCLSPQQVFSVTFWILNAAIYTVEITNNTTPSVGSYFPWQVVLVNAEVVDIQYFFLNWIFPGVVCIGCGNKMAWHHNGLNYSLMLNSTFVLAHMLVDGGQLGRASIGYFL